jgi:hypothetical protein
MLSGWKMHMAEEAAEAAGIPLSKALEHLGLGIWLSARPKNPSTLKIHGKVHHRFLDRLFIPNNTNDLTHQQIAIINRFREKNLGVDTQFAYRDKLRRLFEHCFAKLEIRSALEIGPGKFPLICPTFREYRCFDIDHEAVETLQKRGIDATSSYRFPQNHSAGGYDLCFAVFVFHFKIDRTIIVQAARDLAEEGLFIFNVVSHHAQIRTAVFSTLSSVGYAARGLDLHDAYGKDDMIFFCTRDTGTPTAVRAYNTFAHSIANF